MLLQSINASGTEPGILWVSWANDMAVDALGLIQYKDDILPI